ncbi:MAG: hypothetical protein WC408_06800 [Candidatus Micrarchaeia archaeon]|jgi:hypothetical protein
MQLDLPLGPWTQMFGAQWGNYPLMVYQNPDKMMLLTLFEKKEGKIVGALTFLKKGFVIEGDTSKVSLAQRQDIMIVSKVSRERAGKYLLISSSPEFIEYNKDSLIKAITDQSAELERLSKAMVEILHGYECKVTDFKTVDEELLQPLLGDPFSIFAYLSVSKDGGSQKTATNLTKCLMGIDRDNEPVNVRLSSLRSVVISGGRLPARLHAMHLIIESSLINNISAMVFDSANAFTGLAKPNKDSSKYEEFKLTSIPLGFPFRQYELEKGLFIDLANLDPDIFLSTFGIEKSDIATIVKKIYSEKQGSFSAITDLISAISQMHETAEITRYTINKAIRAMMIIQKCSPNVFAKSSTFETTASSGLGKVMHVNLAGHSVELSTLATYSLLEQGATSDSSESRILLAFQQDVAEIPANVMAKMRAVASQGVNIVLSGQHDSDFSEFKPSLRIEIIGDEAVISEEGEKQHRIRLRPAYSLDSELDAS